VVNNSERTIELIGCESGDWYVLKVDGKVYCEGHDVPHHTWLALVCEIGNVTVRNKTISDEEMEKHNI